MRPRGEWNIVVPQAPLVQVGERYIFFLNPDKRPVPANTAGFPRFDVAGVWSGLIRVVDGAKIQFAPAAVAELHKSDNTDLASFSDQLRALIHTLWDRAAFTNN